ncbi:DUF4157 domain-containing protein [Streptomyces sp. NPDC059590]|uniref:eCIS core domain-containing protein n=1 Tax=Streptomyces sp. NPDC059590 TaxID=3346877 RepID=UPI0036AD4A37
MHERQTPENERSPGRSRPWIRPAAAHTTTGPTAHLAFRDPVTPGQMGTLQSLAGNAAVVQRLAQDQEQDRHEHDGACGHTPSVQRSTVLDVLAMPGQPFDGPLRTEMEARFDRPLSHLRVHTDVVAQRSAEEINAEAYTSGHHMVFKPQNLRNKRVVAHEIAHTFDQEEGEVPGTDQGDGTRMSSPGDAGEKAADAKADEVMSKPVPAGAAAAFTPTWTGTGTAAHAETATPIGDVAVQRWPGARQSTRDARRRPVDRRGRTREAERQRNHDGTEDLLTAAENFIPSRRRINGTRLWDGDRVPFAPGVREQILASDETKKKLNSRGELTYRCRGRCKEYKTADKMDIDHVEGIIAYIVRAANFTYFQVDLGLYQESFAGIYRDLWAITQDDAIAAASQATNLRAKCARCNRRDGQDSESRDMDRSMQEWGEPYYAQANEQTAAPGGTSSYGGGDYGDGGGSSGYGGGGAGYVGADIYTVTREPNF